MTITSIQKVIDSFFIGKTIAKQPGIHESYWGTKITAILPCDLNYGCDIGFIISTNKKSGGSNSFTVVNDREIGFEE